MGITDEIERLHKLKMDGALTDDEFVKMKADLLAKENSPLQAPPSAVPPVALSEIAGSAALHRKGDVRPIGVFVGVALLLAAAYLQFSWIPERSVKGGRFAAGVANALNSEYLTSESKRRFELLAAAMGLLGIGQLIVGSRHRQDAVSAARVPLTSACAHCGGQVNASGFCLACKRRV